MLSTTNEQEFFEIVLADLFGSYTYYLAINIESPDYSGPVVVQNGDLYVQMMRHGLVSDKDHYQAYMLPFLTSNARLHLPERILDEARVFPTFQQGKTSVFKYCNLDFVKRTCIEEERYFRTDLDQDVRRAAIAACFRMKVGVLFACFQGRFVMVQNPNSRTLEALMEASYDTN